eukprot:Opistho-2@14725
MENQLLKKLQIKAEFSLNLYNAPKDVLAILGEIPSTINLFTNHQQNTDAILIFAITQAELSQSLQQLNPLITEQTICWVCYPKAKSSLAADLNLMQNWEALKTFDLTPCASAAINDTWTSIRIKPVSALKKSGRANADIQQNQFADYIDVANKKVNLPEDLAIALAKYPAAATFYEALSYTNKKEYVLWILTAKQEKTKQERLQKTIEKLLEGKKNPTEK